MDGDLEKKTQRAIDLLRERGRVIVALSGGVDSAALLALAVRAVGPNNVVAVTGRSDAVTDDDLDDARRIAVQLGVEHVVVATREMTREGYRKNAGDRCFHCRTELFELLTALGARRGIEAIAYGAITDDLGDHRPGMTAARDYGVLAPFLDADICKNDVRELAKSTGLHVTEKPASPCLASRIPIGTEVTAERLRAVGRAEAGVRELGFRQVRVRHHGTMAKLELGAGEAERLADDELRRKVVGAVLDAGFVSVALDPRGYRPGGAGGIAVPLHSIGPEREIGQ